MSNAWTDVAWPAHRVDEALAALAEKAGLGVRRLDAGILSGKRVSNDPDTLARCIETTADWLGVEAEPVEEPYRTLGRLLRGASPALLQLPGEHEPRFLVLTGSDRTSVTLLTPAFTQIRVDASLVRSALCSELEASVQPTVDGLLLEAGVPRRRQRRAGRALLNELLSSERIGGCWLIRPSAGAGFWTQARVARLPTLLAGLVGAHFVEYLLWVVAWGLIGWMTLAGRVHSGWMVAWLMLLATIVPFRLLSSWTGGLFAVRASALIKRRLLAGALKLQPEEVRHQGVGQLLGRVLESEAIESLALGGGFLSILAVVELVIAAVVLGNGAGGMLHVALLLASIAGATFLGVRYYRRREEWTEQRLTITHELVEQMLGHRTRLAQEPRERWNDGEDQALERYVAASVKLDRDGLALDALLPRVWFLIGLLGLAPAFIAGESSTAALAVGLGGVLLATQALSKFADGFARMSAAAIAWQRIRAFWNAAARTEPIAHPQLAARRNGAGRRKDTLLDAHDLVFRYSGRTAPVLKNIDTRISVGDHLLLEGPSGGGKSTLAAVLTGSRVPESGLLLFNGLDRATLGAQAWRRRAVMSPQFHDNFIIMGTLAFNALMGRDWPPSEADVAEAEEVCRALGLGPLLTRMPSGMQQVVGETGWQLSHGEKSRLYIARALLQRADLIVLDESFAALDPVTLQKALSVVLERAKTALVIAHP